MVGQVRVITYLGVALNDGGTQEAENKDRVNTSCTRKRIKLHFAMNHGCIGKKKLKEK